MASEYDKIAMLTDLKYSELLKEWRTPTSDMSPFLKDWQKWQNQHQKFVMLAISNNGKALWKQLILARQDILQVIS